MYGGADWATVERPSWVGHIVFWAILGIIFFNVAPTFRHHVESGQPCVCQP
jgi:hypothetical protein